MIAYRRRKGQTGLPVQLRYNMPIEIFYTVVPLILVIGFFAFTARDQTILETQTEDPDVSIIGDRQAVGVGLPVQRRSRRRLGRRLDHGRSGRSPRRTATSTRRSCRRCTSRSTRRCKIELQSRDVIHSFWIIDFLYKKDMYIGHDNYWSFTPTREGTYAGKCAELCGEYHSAMLFNVKVVSEDEYEDYLDSLRAAGQTGDITDDYDRLQNLPGHGCDCRRTEGDD